MYIYIYIYAERERERERYTTRHSPAKGSRRVAPSEPVRTARRDCSGSDVTTPELACLLDDRALEASRREGERGDSTGFSTPLKGFKQTFGALVGFKLQQTQASHKQQNTAT